MSPLKSSLTHQQQAVFYTNTLKNRINPPKKGHYQLLEKTIDALSERLYEVAEKLGRANRKIQSLEANLKNKKAIPIEQAAPDTMTDSPQAIEMHLSFLIHAYINNSTKSKAEAVARQLERLLRHPDCIGYPNDRCSYRKMLIQWRAMV